MSDLSSDPSRLVFVVATSGLLALSVIGLPLAILGVFKPWIVVPPTLILWWVLASYGLELTRSAHTRTSQITSIVSLLIAVGFSAFAGAHSSEHLLTNRDPGVYLVTGEWLASQGDLLYDPAVPVEGTLNSSTTWPQGIHDAGGGLGYFQFQHSTGIVLAAANWAGGDWLMLRAMSAVAGVGLLGIYLLGRSMAGPTFGLLPAVVAGSHPAFLHIAKDAYSEPLAMVFAMGALWVWMATHRVTTRAGFLACGLLLGAGSLARIDGWLTAIGFLLGLIYLMVTGRERTIVERQDAGWLLVGFFFTAGLSVIDLVTRSPVYLRDLGGEAVPMIVAFVGVAALALLTASPRSRLRPLGRHLQRFAPPSVAIGLLVAGLYGLFMRPYTVVAVRDHPLSVVGGLQRLEGLDVDPFRTYAEMSLEWLARYQGHLPILFGIVAVSIASFVILRRSGDRRTPALGASLVVMGVYLWRPSITPDHFWAMRRFLPVLLPLGFVLTALAARLVLRKWKDREWVALTLAGLLALSIVQATVVGWPVAAIRTHVGAVAAIQEVCDLLPEDAVVLYDDRSQIMAPALRTRCGVPITSADRDDIVDSVIDAGLTPIVLSSDIQCTTTDLGSVETTLQFPERSLSIAPQGAQSTHLTVSLATATGSNGRADEPSSPDDADASLLVEVETTWAPEADYSMIAAMGDYTQGMWLQYGPTGVVELWITTDQGHFGIPASPSIDDGTPRIVGGYLLDGVLHSTCGGQEVASTAAPGSPLFEDGDVDLAPNVEGAPGMQPYEGLASITEGVVDPELTADP